MLKNSLKKELETWYEKTCTPDFITLDPIKFPRSYTKREDIEITAFLSAAIAWAAVILFSAQQKKCLL